MPALTVRAQRQRIFKAVFHTDLSLPTPLLSSSAPGEPFGGPPLATNNASTRGRRSAGNDAGLSDQVKWDRAWHLVTSRIQLPSSVAIEDSFGTLPPQSQDGDSGFYEALPIVLDPATSVPRATHTEDILLWHARQVRQHFVHHVLPLLAACAGLADTSQIVTSTVNTLAAAHRQYLNGLLLIVRGISDEAALETATSTFRRDLHAVIGNSWTQGLINALNPALARLLRTILSIGRRFDGRHDFEDPNASTARKELLSLLESLQKVGLAGDKFQVLFAELMDSCMHEFIQTAYARVWGAIEVKDPNTGSVLPGCMAHLCDWVENQYGRLAVEVFGQLGGQVKWADVEQWRDIAIGRLATLRIHELFDIVLHWPETRGGLDDLGYSVTTPQRRLALTDTFSAALQHRLLHPGRSTLEILQTYISMIRTFHALDHSKVLLDRVVHALQLYLCQRDDAIQIVVTGLLANPEGINALEAKTKLVELAVIMNEASQLQRIAIDEEDLGWDDMNWVPDPVDAGVNYKRPKNEDVVGTLISALGSQDIFIKEFQHIIAERLLSKQPGFQQEIKVLGLLKKRFGEHALQNCDVMVKDIHDSRRVDAVLRRKIRSAQQPGAPGLSYHSKILSRLFWPSLTKETFKVPRPVAEIQAQYEAGFEQLKSSRKLGWLDNLGTATVSLELEDRTVELECKTYEAAVIFEFQGDGTQSDTGAQQRTFEEIWQSLLMDEDALELALRFWMTKKVLKNVGNRTYVVLERLDSEAAVADAHDDGSVDEGIEISGSVSPKKAKVMDAKEAERRTIYWQFILGMLTNSAPAMPLSQIAMMMKMLIADGCHWSTEELQEFLEERIMAGELELAGGKYRLPKK
ncbi:anaphase-promoting complex subunit ApcB, putative [Cordyceps militaris CM01]|uniref:Anaphase-promoting complex subunit 2 n=2 Tax=Cordyceps militaris TaxID=73501 RepID=G3JHS1_CORMM|nr:anaphase-promoting complex subunit ApcB, putative [Cordyceps militaris CM01]ATY59742.1 anaphase-promoting complex subunit [Cordyceps militaris]EGX91777.1 anaphase-promoting complex subunit ApcB, putative [Cordyceps militaris CM01]